MDYVVKLFGVFQCLYDVEEFLGIGIGFVIVKCVINKYGGWIWVELEFGKGVVFYFILGEE